MSASRELTEYKRVSGSPVEDVHKREIVYCDLYLKGLTSSLYGSKLKKTRKLPGRFSAIFMFKTVHL